MDISQTVHIIEVLENFLEKRRPPEELRKRLDLGYKIQGESIFILEIRPALKNSGRVIEHEVAKATFVKSREHWKIFWKHADLKWHAYEPSPTAKSIEEFMNVVIEDNQGCFWG